MEHERQIDYFEKYAPLLRLMATEKDFDFLASEQGYTSDLAISYRGLRREAVRGYLLELASDFEDLEEALTPLAASNEELARSLYEARKTWTRAVLYLRARLVLELLLPTPKPRSSPGAFRRVLVRMLPEPTSARKLLGAMNDLSRRLQVS
ncbi:MAG: hypothetical protein IPP47_17455 [Bryobacterales bacterium]|nr:hypothetical protein [Bryobacterales bacterium]